MKKILNSLIVMSMLCASFAVSNAALFPKAVLKKVAFQDKEAIEIAGLLGINPARPSALKLRLHPSNEWAVYLRDSPHPDPSSSNVERPRYNMIKYNPTPPQLTIEGDWLDTRTGSFPSKPRFSFSSPFLAEKDPKLPSWTEILKKNSVSLASMQTPNKVLFEKKVGENFKLTIFEAQNFERNPQGEKGFSILISAE